MKIELLSIGDEIMTGHTVNTNAAFLAESLTEIGLAPNYISSCGDSLESMEEAMHLALKRAQLVITTGGLGPTDDDNTKKALVRVFKRNLIFDEEVLEDIKGRFARRGIEMPAINQNQALLPQGATFFPNSTGSAVGICLTEKDRTLIALPGVPHEMRQIMTDSVVAFLRQKPGRDAIKVVKIRTTGIVESRLAEMITGELRLDSRVRLAYLPGYAGVDLRLLATAATEAEADELLREPKRILEKIAGKYQYGYDKETLEEAVGQLLRDNDRTVAVAESCTGGRLGDIFTRVAGSSSYFLGGVITYSNAAKQNLLGVPVEVIDKLGAVSEATARAMAEGCRSRFDSSYAISITGIAGPDGGSDDKPVGTTWIGLATSRETMARRFTFGNNREINRTRACYAALELLRREILDIV